MHTGKIAHCAVHSSMPCVHVGTTSPPGPCFAGRATLLTLQMQVLDELRRICSFCNSNLKAGLVCSARQQAQQEGGSLLVSLASCLMECVYSLIDYLTKFATVRMAITGEAFLEAARRATDLLARNFLKVSRPPPPPPPSPYAFFCSLFVLLLHLFFSPSGPFAVPGQYQQACDQAD